MNEIAKIDNQKIQTQTQLNQSLTPFQMLQIAVEQGADIDKLDKLMQLEERWRENQAKQAFYQALTEFKKNPPKVAKDAINKQYNSKYSTLGHFTNVVNAALGENGLTASWEFDQKDNGEIEVTCTLTHSMSHSKSVSLIAPPDTSGAKNKIQQIKSTITYLELATFQAITGIVATDNAADDDGNSYTNKKVYITPDQVCDLQNALAVADLSETDLCKQAKIGSIELLEAQRFAGCKKWIEQEAKK